MELWNGIRRPFAYIYNKLCDLYAWLRPGNHSEPLRIPLKTVMKVTVKRRDPPEQYPAYYENLLRNSWDGRQVFHLD